MEQEASMTPALDSWHWLDRHAQKFDSMIHPNLGPVSHLNPYPHIGIPFNWLGAVDAADNLGSTLENPKASGTDKLMAWLGLGGNAGLSAAEMFGAAAPAVGALGKVSSARAVENELTSGQPLFRVMRDPEAYDLLKRGHFAPSPFGSEVKYFWGSQEAAEQWQLENSGFLGSTSIIKTGINDISLLDGPRAMDSINGAYVLPNEHLHKLWAPFWLK